MRSRMTPDQLKAGKGNAQTGNTVASLAAAANGLGVTRAQRDQADGELARRLGKRGAAKAKEAALRSAGARPKVSVGSSADADAAGAPGHRRSGERPIHRRGAGAR